MTIDRNGLVPSCSSSADTERHCTVAHCGGDGVAADVVGGSSAVDALAGSTSSAKSSGRAFAVTP